MAWTSVLAIYFVIWWTVLFAVLPWGMRTQEEEGTVVPGTVPSAPAHPRMLRTVIVTTLVAAVVFGGFLALVNSGYKLDDFPLFKPHGAPVVGSE